MKHTQDLCDAIIAVKFEDIPDDVIDTAKACMLDTLGVALAGCNSPLVNKLHDTVESFNQTRQVTVLGRRLRASVPDAALINGTSAHALDFDDMHIASAMHPSSPIIPAALAVAEHRNATGAELLRAIILGTEAAIRIGETVNPAHYQNGWHATATLGHFGAAIAASALLGLHRQQTIAALGIAGTQAAGLKESFGTMAKPLHAGHAARNGVFAAYLAARDFTSPSNILEGEQGFGKVMSENAQLDYLLDNWKSDWKLRKILYKPHASSFCTQALIEGVLSLRRKHNLEAADICSIRIAVSHLSIENARVGEPRTGLEAKFSLTHAAAQALIYGQATIADFTDARAIEPRLVNLRKSVSISQDLQLGWPEAVVDIETQDGRQLHEAVDLQRRTADADEKWAVVEPKFRQVTCGILSTVAQESTIQWVQQLPLAHDLNGITQLTALSGSFVNSQSHTFNSD